VLISKGEDIRTKGTHRRRSEEYPLYSTTTTIHKDNSCGSKRGEREREIKRKKREKKTGQLPFQSTVSKRLLCRFICGCFESTKRKETAVTATSTDELK
jgi:hypothetical protein